MVEKISGIGEIQAHPMDRPAVEEPPPVKEKEIEDFIVIEKSSKGKLEYDVLAHMAEGWVLSGGVNTCVYGGEMFYLQAMLKYEDEE